MFHDMFVHLSCRQSEQRDADDMFVHFDGRKRWAPGQMISGHRLQSLMTLIIFIFWIAGNLDFEDKEQGRGERSGSAEKRRETTGSRRRPKGDGGRFCCRNSSIHQC